MSTATDPVGFVRTFLDKVRPNAEGLPDAFGANVASPEQAGGRALPVRLNGLLAQLVENEREIARSFVWQRGVATQELISGRVPGTAYDSALRELYRTAEADRSSSREQWYDGLALADKTAFDNHCLAVVGAGLLPLIPPDLSACLRGALARLALEYAALVRRAVAERKEREKCLANRGRRNRTVVESILRGIAHAEDEARSRLEGRWFRELTPEQQAAFDSYGTDTNLARAGQAVGAGPGPGQAGAGQAEAAENPPETLAGQSRPEGEQDEVGDPALSPLQYDILDALRALKATDAEKRKTASKIAEKVGGDATEQSCKGPLADLKRLVLVDSKTGKHGGTWFTSEGLALINRVRKQ